ncbi:MAG: hypothetical protein WBG53_23380 [Rhodococcus sp. (in: high G+C Gram-positive bacteria)]
MATHIALGELDHGGAVQYLSQPVATALADTGLVEVRPHGEGRWLLLPCGRVGAVQIDDLLVQVHPKEKVGLTRLLFLLGYAADPGFLDGGDDVEAVEHPDLWPALAEAMARVTERALLHGLLQGYRTVDEAARTVRGRIRIGDQIARRPGLLMPLEVTYDDYTVDTSENRILRAALRRMLAVPRLPAVSRARLAHLERRLDGVGLIRPGAVLPRWQSSRLNMRYQPALRLAEVILRNGSAEAGPGGLHVAAFVVQMWKVFEDFVSTALTESLNRRQRGQTRTQYVSFLDVPQPEARTGKVRVEVDLVHVVDGSPRLIFDAKYKVASDNGKYPNADHYQMLAYCTALQVKTAWLVYAAGNGAPAARRIVNTDITVMEYPLDLRAQPSELLAQVDRLTDTAWSVSLGPLDATPGLTSSAALEARGTSPPS